MPAIHQPPALVIKALCAFLTCLILPAQGAELVTEPRTVQLSDAYARRQLLISLENQDVTRQSQYESADPNIAQVDERGFVAPIKAGTTEILVRHGELAARIPVTVADLDRERQIDFRNEIEPLLSRFGCNSGGCHGKASGQNGFKLSLFGFDSTFDYQAIALEARGRRVFPSAPERSLLLSKSTAQVPHGGGKRIEPGTEPYHILRRWVEQGMPATSPDAPRVASLRVLPEERLLSTEGTQQLAVLAQYSDGTERDVTAEAQYQSNLEPVASVGLDGYVQSGGQTGEATVMARYMGQVSVFRALVPHGEPLTEIPGFTPKSEIDRLVAEKWKKLGLLPSPQADDATFLRRLTVDLCGRIPTPQEVREFLSDKGPDKREKAIDRLLNSPDYPAFFAMRWGTILRNSNLAGATQAAYAFHNWMKDSIARNRPYDEFVRGVVAASGEWQDAPAINWYWQMRDDQLHQVTADTAQVFLGIRLQCARCHHHPYERWGQDDYYGLAGFFTRLGRKSFGQPPPYYSASRPTTGERNPLTNKVPEPKYPDGDVAEFTAEQDPRHSLVDWMAEPENPYFSKVLVNRLWGHFLGRGLVDQIDDMRETNPPSNPELLDYLARDFVEHKFDVKQIIRQIVSSQVYQLDSTPRPENEHDRQNYARFYSRRLIAEILHDAVDQATGSHTRFSGVSSDARAVDLPHEGFGSYFLDTFDRPQRVTGCECERSSSATLGQVLLISNSDEIENKIADGKGRIAQLIKDKKTDEEIVTELYLATFGRFPKPAELTHATKYIQDQVNRQYAIEDLLWTQLNSKEFLLNH